MAEARSEQVAVAPVVTGAQRAVTPTPHAGGGLTRVLLAYGPGGWLGGPRPEAAKHLVRTRFPGVYVVLPPYEDAVPDLRRAGYKVVEAGLPPNVLAEDLAKHVIMARLRLRRDTERLARLAALLGWAKNMPPNYVYALLATYVGKSNPLKLLVEA